MFTPVFRDLIKPQWLTLIELLKMHGGMPVSELARRTKAGYMTVKSHCEHLAGAGYLVRTRLPRTGVGRPEVHYSLAARADALFPQVGSDFALGLLEDLRAMHGESAPERLLFQHFAKATARWEKEMLKAANPAARACRLAALRVKEGHVSVFEQEPGHPARILECHNPLQPIFVKFPRVVAIEHRMIEQLLGCRVTRHEIPGGPEAAPRVSFELK